MILFLIELFCECTELERSNYVQRCIRKESSFKNSSRCCCTLSYDITKMNYKDFSAFKKNYVSNLEMLRNSLSSLASFCLLVCWHKDGVVFHSVCNYTTGHLFNNKQKTPKKTKKGQTEWDVFSLFTFLIKRIPDKFKNNSFALCFSSKFDTLLLLLTFLSCLSVVTEVIFLNWFLYIILAIWYTVKCK